MKDAQHIRREWTLVSSHGAVLIFVAANPSSTIREIADSVGVTERQVARIIKDLSVTGLIEPLRMGRRNVYTINADAHFRHPLLAHVRLERLIEALSSEIILPKGTVN